MAWGNECWAGSFGWSTYIEFRTSSQEEGRGWVQYKRSIRVKSGDGEGTLVDRSWGGQVALNGVGWYGDSGWCDYGWVAYGKSVTVDCSASYTGWSGTVYRSYCSGTYSPDVPTWQPRDVSGQGAARNSDSSATVTWSNNPTAARPYSGIYVERQTDGGSWVRLKDLGGGAASYTDQGIAKNHVYAYRLLPHNGAGSAPNWKYTGKVCTTPSAPTAASVARDSDGQSTVTFTRGSTYSGLYGGHRVERQVNGGAWSFSVNVAAGSGSYVDRSTTANASYRYRVRSYNAAGSSDWKYTGTVYNTPCAPGKPALARTSDTHVRGTLSNGARTASQLRVQRSTDLKTWADVCTLGGAATSFDDDPGGGTFYYRVRNERGSLVSAWAYSDAVVTTCAPSAPTVTAPASSQVVPTTQASVRVSWRHNSVDGSAQTAAQVRTSADGGKTWDVRDVSGAGSSVDVANGFVANAHVSVQVRTKGVHASYGPWSQAVAFWVRQAPTVSVEEPADGFTVRNMPLHVRIEYADPSGTLAAGMLSVEDASGSTVYSRDLAGVLEFDLAAAEWLPSDGEDYRLCVAVRSSSTLQAEAQRAVAVSFDLPAPAIAVAVPDPSTGHVSVTVRAGRVDSAAPMASAALWRVVDGVRTLLADGLHDGSEVDDAYAPLNTDYAYEVASFAESGAAAASRFPGRVESDLSFVYWDGGAASGRLDPQDQVWVEPAFETFVVAGKEFPVAVVSDNVSETHEMSWKVGSREEAMAFYRALRSGGPLVFKTLYGAVFHGVATAQMTPSLADAEGSWEVSMTVTRTDGDDL